MGFFNDFFDDLSDEINKASRKVDEFIEDQFPEYEHGKKYLEVCKVCGQKRNAKFLYQEKQYRYFECPVADPEGRIHTFPVLMKRYEVLNFAGKAAATAATVIYAKDRYDNYKKKKLGGPGNKLS